MTRYSTRRVWSTAAWVCLSAFTAWAQAPPPQPGPEHKRLEVFAGTWTYVRELRAGPLGPGGKFVGTNRFEMLGGFFLVRRYEERGPSGVVTGMDVLGYDPVRKSYTNTFFNSTGATGSGPVTVDGSTWNFNSTGTAGGGRPFQQRCALTFGAGSTSVAIRCDVSTDGTSWTPRFEGTWTKASS